jgi:hypothetical protein
MEDVNDWYQNNFFFALYVLVSSVMTFMIVFVLVFLWMRHRFTQRSVSSSENSRLFIHESSDSLEVMLIKKHIVLVRSLSIIGIALQIYLLTYILRVPGKSRGATSYWFSLFRPAANIASHLVGFMTSTHAIFRNCHLVVLAQIIITDMMSEVTNAMMINCLQLQGLHCGDTVVSSLEQKDLKAIIYRDLGSLFISTWIMLETGYLCVAIGCCTSRYSNRKLSLSRPVFNVRAALQHYFPALHVRRKLAFDTEFDRDITKYR